MSTQIRKWLGNPPANCEVCHASITDTFIDGRTIHGPWANMCPTCHKEIGVGLGTGRGQKYVKHGIDWIKEEG